MTADTASFLDAGEDAPSKRAILRAALRLFVAKGYEATSIREIAAEAGYTNPALFKFFASKQELAIYVFEKSYRELFDIFEPYIELDGSVDEVMDAWAAAYVRLVAERLDAFLFVHEHLGQLWPKVSRRFGKRTLFALMRKWVQSARAKGRVSAAVPIELQIAAVSGFFHQFATMVRLGELDRARVLGMRDGVATMLAGILEAGAT